MFTRDGELPVETWDELAKAAGAPILACEVLDSDGAILHWVIEPGERWVTCLQLEGLLSHLVPPIAPFDDDGQRLDDVAARELEEAYERQVEAERESIRTNVPAGVEAARRAVNWARSAEFVPRESNEQIAAIHDGNHTFVEETFDDLLHALGVLSREGET